MFAKRISYLTGAILVLIFACIASVMFGARDIPFSDVLAAFAGESETVNQAAAALRIPRTLLAVVIGAALAVSGLAMQAVTRNPLADPGIFGVLAGASLFVVTGITFFDLHSQFSTMLVAIAGSFTAAIFVYFVGSLGPGGVTNLKLALAGAATAAALSSFSAAILLPRVDVMDKFRFWQIGSVGGAQWEQILAGLPLFAVGFALAIGTATGMNALALGDDLAQGLGVSVGVQRLLASLSAVILAGTATALAGPIGFLGLIVPHFCRLLLGSDYRWLIPATAISGGSLLVIADTVGRVINRPAEVAVGVLLPILGAPIFMYIVRRQKVREL
ncbi:MAG: iron ABC transporter permease [Arcanobacterium sp.]|nr:iron ABC transporter permease [Arcanobacterium sp.]